MADDTGSKLLKYQSGAVIKTVEMHTGGEPLRIIVSGSLR